MGPQAPGEQPKLPIPGVQNIIAVGSGKGGVGKSTIAVNLAVTLAKLGNAVGLLDADVYGPNVPLMMGVRATPHAIGQRIQPLEAHGLRLMSMGFLNPGDKPLVWRGPMLNSVIQQFLRSVEWGPLDYLVIDLPPGTGDVQLTLIQTTPLTGAIIVTTPSDVSLEDARKAVLMFEQVREPVLGIVENMSLHVCSSCGHVEHIFGQGGGQRMANDYGVKLLGELPLDALIREEADGGTPSVVAAPSSARAQAYLRMARRTAAALSRRARDRSAPFPQIVVEES